VIIPEHIISEIKNRTDIVELISDVVSLKRQGNGFVGLCPFHSEKTPSFSVNSERGMFHCFGCGEAGDAFDFLMKHGGMSFYEAAKDLAGRSGVEIPQPDMSPEERDRLQIRENLYSVNRLAADYYYHMLHRTPEGQKAMAYLAGRGISPEMMEAFQIGYAPAAWDGLLRFLGRKRQDLRFARDAGLVIPRKNGPGYYDRFRDRIMFPILDAGKRVLGFGGRVLDDGLPKYLNSPETLIFNKRRSLFGIHRAKASAKESGRLYVVEGYFDVVALHQHGIDNAVATLGTALTEEHIRQGFSKTVFLVFDADAAGVKAAIRGAGLFLKWRIDTRIMRLPKGEDPDSFIFKAGPEGFKKIASEAKGMVDFIMEDAIQRFGSEAEGKIRTIGELSQILATINDGLVRSVYAKEVSEKVGVPEAAVLREIQKISALESERRNAAMGSQGSVEVGASFNRSADAAPSRQSFEINRFESMIIEMMLNCPGVWQEVRNRKIIDLFQDPNLAAIGRRILENIGDNENNVWRVVDGIDDPAQRRLLGKMRAVKQSPWPFENCKKCLAQFERSRKSDVGKQMVKELKKALKVGDDQMVEANLNKIQAYAKHAGADTANKSSMTSGGQTT
jgi:DNA primase